MHSFLRKFITCFVTGLTISSLLLVLGNSGTISWFPPIVVFSLVGFSLISSIIFPFLWNFLEKNNRINSEKVNGYLIDIIRYTLAFNLASFGWKKLFGLQFIVPLEISSQPMNKQSGEWLTWYYFGFSTSFSTIIALLQIIGSYLLLFRRTFLISAVVLFALLLNIALVDIFYHLNPGATTPAIVLTIGFLFLMLTQHKKLIEVFIKSDPYLPSTNLENIFSKNILRFSAIALSLLFVYYLSGK